MQINPEQFVFYLKNSSLSSEEQKVVLDLLPKLKKPELSVLFTQLKEDHRQMRKIIQKVFTKRETIQFDFYKDLKTAQ